MYLNVFVCYGIVCAFVFGCACFTDPIIMLRLETVSEIVSETASYFALIPAAGVGARMGGVCPKQYLPLHGKAMLWHTVQAFLASPLIRHIFVVVSKEDAYVDQVFPLNSHRLTVLRCGGATRQVSVYKGLQAIRQQVGDNDWVLVHDGARPGLTQALISRLVEAVRLHPVGGLLGLPVVDTVKQVQGDNLRTLDRRGLWLAQTPQMFRYHLLVQALQQALDNAQVTDESSAVEALGYVPLLVAGHARNFKLTLPEDVAMMEAYLTCIPAA